VAELSYSVDRTWLINLVKRLPPDQRDRIGIAYHVAAANYYDDMPEHLSSEHDPEGEHTDEFTEWVVESVDLDELETILRGYGFQPRMVDESQVWDPPSAKAPSSAPAIDLAVINRHRAKIGQRPLDPVAAGWQLDDIVAEARRIRSINPKPRVSFLECTVSAVLTGLGVTGIVLGRKKG
jgi:hypothetical protein